MLSHIAYMKGGKQSTCSYVVKLNSHCVNAELHMVTTIWCCVD
uniref:Uncharacterized protein n=1 Tax=Arundo donax TaxID=35708 RepID=A0A0A9GHE8_ARUDO